MPALGWILGDDLPSVDTPDTSADLFRLLATTVEAVPRGLLLAGYRPYRFDAVRAGVPPTITIDITDDGTTGELPDLGPLPSAGAGIVITVLDLVHERALEAWGSDHDEDLEVLRDRFSHAIAIEAADGAPWTGLTPGPQQQVALWSAETWLSAEWLAEIRECARLIGEDIVAALARRWAEGGVTPRGRAGLLWLLNPLFWFERDITFPGSEFDPDQLGNPATPLAWPAVTSAAAAALDPLAVDRPGGTDLDVLILVGGTAWQELTRVPDIHLPPLVLAGSTPGYAHTLAHLLATNDDGPMLALAAAGNLATAAGGYSDETLGTRDPAMLSVILRRPWIDALLAMADGGLFTPAGYPIDTVVFGSTPDADELTGTDPVVAVWYPATSTASKKVVLEINRQPGLEPAATVLVSASQWCRVDLAEAMAWDFIPSIDDTRLKIVVVAGPGVYVAPDNDEGRVYDLEIFRVWDYESVPPRGARVQPELLMGPYIRAWWPYDPAAPADETPTAAPALYGFTVYPLPDGVYVEFPTPMAAAATPSWRLIATGPTTSGDAMMAFDVAYGHRTEADAEMVLNAGEPSVALLTMWVSDGFTVRIERLGGATGLPLVHEPEVWRIKNPKKIPLQGATLPTSPDGKYVRFPPAAGPPLAAPTVPLVDDATPVELESTDFFNYSFVVDVFDVLLGSIPIVGDVLDVAELAVSFYTNTDKWGRPVTNFDRMCMAFGVLVPFASSAMFEGAGRHVDDIIAYARSSNDSLLTYLFDVFHASPSERQSLEAFAATSPTFHRLDPDNQLRVLDELARLPQYRDLAMRFGLSAGNGLIEESFDLVDLFDDTGLYPWLPGLLHPYKQWLRDHGYAASTPDAIAEWVKRTTGPPKAILEAMLGTTGLRYFAYGEAAVRSPKLSTRWLITNPMMLDLSTRRAADYLGSGLRPVTDAAGELVARWTADPRLLDFATPGELPQLLGFANSLITGVCQGADLDSVDVALLRQLMGNRTLEPANLAEMVLRGCKLANDRVVAVGHAAEEALGVTLGTELTLEHYLRLTGHRSFFLDLITQSGYQHGGAMEVTVGAEEYVRRLLLAESVPPEMLMTLQNAIGSYKGPDLVRVFEDMLQIVDSKAVVGLATSMRSQADVSRQANRWTRLLLAQVLQLDVPDGVRRPAHWEMLFRVDSTMFLDNAVRHQRMSTEDARYLFLERLNEFSEQVNENLEASGRQISGHAPQIVLVDQPLYLPYR